MCLGYFHLAAEERRVGAGKLVAHLYREAHRAGIEAALVFGNVAAAALRFPPVTFFDVISRAIKLHPRAGRQAELDIELAPARDRPVDAKLHAGHPTPVV